VSTLAKPPIESPTPIGDEYLTEEQFAHLMKRDVRSTRRWAAKRIGPPRISFNSKLVLYRRSSVLAWLNAMESGQGIPTRKAARKAR
jgi:hypothetical protein